MARPYGLANGEVTVGQLVNAVKDFGNPKDDAQIETLQEQYLSRVIDENQLVQQLRSVAGDHAFRGAGIFLQPLLECEVRAGIRRALQEMMYVARKDLGFTNIDLESILRE